MMNNNHNELEGKGLPQERLGMLTNSDLPYELSQLVPAFKLTTYFKQMKAPQPIPLKCTPRRIDTPPMYSDEFFGKISHTEAEKKLAFSGTYLIRQSGRQTEYYALALRFMNKKLHYRLYYDANTGKHYVREKKFDTVYALVSDGLNVLCLEIYATVYYNEKIHRPRSMEKNSYVIVHKRKLEALAKESGGNKPSCYDTMDTRVQGYKAHNFKVQTFKGLNWCDYCANFMWGLVQQGVKCEDCGYTAHRKCSDKIPGSCSPPITNVNGCFGINLNSMAKLHEENVPWIVKKCIQEIESRGIESEGLYRVSGFAEEIESLRVALDKNGAEVDISPDAYENINVITGVLKLYFRLLPIPLINQATLDGLITSLSIESQIDQINSIKSSLTILPEAHYYTLKYLVEHLCRVASRHLLNKMSSQNLATVFCPSLMPFPLMNQSNGLPDMSKEIEVLGLIIGFNDLVFVH